MYKISDIYHTRDMFSENKVKNFIAEMKCWNMFLVSIYKHTL